MKKLTVLFLAVVMLIASTVSIYGCDKKDIISNDPNTINVRIRNAGYGKTYIEKLAEQFNATFKDEGLAVHVVPAREDLVGDVVLRDIYTNSGIDVYFTDSIPVQKAANHIDYGQMCADITDLVYNQHPIKADGTEEEQTVKEKLSIWDNSPILYNDKCYGLPFAASFGVLAVNKAVLDSYHLEVPRTTNEMIDCAKKIMEDASYTGTLPFTYALSDNMYIMSTINPWIAQYNGVEEYNEFWNFEKADGTPLTDDEISQVFGCEGVRKALEIVYYISDYNMAAYGSSVQEFKGAQSKVMKGEAVFYSVGDWMFNEEFYGFPSFRKDITCINAPILSALGEKLFGPTTSYGYTLEKADKILSTIVKYSDKGMYAEDIEPIVEQELSVELQLEDVLTVCERHGIVRCSIAPNMIISEKSTKKDIAAKFLRFCASTDAGRIFASESRTSSCYALGEGVESEYPWVNGQNTIAGNKYFSTIQAEIGGYRTRAKYNLSGIFPAPCMEGLTVIGDLLEEGKTVYDDDTFEFIILTDDKGKPIMENNEPKRINVKEFYVKVANDKCDFMVEKVREALNKGTWSKK